MTKRSDVEDVKTFDDLCMMARKLGYDSPPEQLYLKNGASVTNLIDFFEDNPGAIEAVVTWVLDEGSDRDGEDLEDEDEDDTEESDWPIDVG